MFNNPESLSPKLLEKILLVLDDIRYRAELKGSPFLLIHNAEGIEGVSGDEYDVIMGSLLKGGFLKERLVGRSPLASHYAFWVRTKKFNEYYDKIKLQLNRGKRKPVKAKAGLRFDPEKGILHFKAKKIGINLRNHKTVACRVLEYIFNPEEDLSRECNFEDIENSKYQDLDDYSWKTSYRACMAINEKVRKATGEEDFLIYTSGGSGLVRINDKYLK